MSLDLTMIGIRATRYPKPSQRVNLCFCFF